MYGTKPATFGANVYDAGLLLMRAVPEAAKRGKAGHARVSRRAPRRPRIDARARRDAGRLQHVARRPFGLRRARACADHRQGWELAPAAGLIAALPARHLGSDASHFQRPARLSRHCVGRRAGARRSIRSPIAPCGRNCTGGRCHRRKVALRRSTRLLGWTGSELARRPCRRTVGQRGAPPLACARRRVARCDASRRVRARGDGVRAPARDRRRARGRERGEVSPASSRIPTGSLPFCAITARCPATRRSRCRMRWWPPRRSTSPGCRQSSPGAGCPRHSRRAHCLPPRALPPAPMEFRAGVEAVHLRFIPGVAIARPGADLHGGRRDGKVGRAVHARAHRRNLRRGRASVLALPRAPRRPLPAGRRRRTAQREHRRADLREQRHSQVSRHRRRAERRHQRASGARRAWGRRAPAVAARHPSTRKQPRAFAARSLRSIGRTTSSPCCRSFCAIAA